MKTRQYTPGPWSYNLTKSRGVVYGNGTTIANIPQDARSWRENAALIAIAPDLVDGLVESLRYLEHPDVVAIPFAKRSLTLAAQIRTVLTKVGK